MPIRKAVTLRTIASELGLTVQTVSKALKGKPGMSEATRQLVVRTAEKLGYYTPEQIRSLKADLIAPYPNGALRFLLVLSHESASFNKLLLAGLHERFSAFGHTVESLLLPASLRGKEIVEWMDEQELALADGVFIAPSISQEAGEQALMALPVPRILFGFPPPGIRIDSVIWDVYEAAYQAVAYLRGLGHERIMYVGDIRRQRGYILRWQAFLLAMEKHGLTISPEEHSTEPRDATWLVRLRARLAERRPTAIVCGIDDEVEPLYELCRELGLRIPEDISFVGIVNEQPPNLPEVARPQLPILETGFRAADRMLWRIANPTRPFEHIRLQCDWIAGSTTAAPPAR
jgi:LacI family transcriptional regulator